jgi:hypothetical protein
MRTATHGEFTAPIPVIGIVLVLLLTAPACVIAIPQPGTPTPQPTVESPLKQNLISTWHTDHGGRFGNANLEFASDETLTVTNLDSGGTQILHYAFVAADTIVLTGPGNLAGAAQIEISGDELNMTITFSDEVFGEIYPGFKRVK